MTDRFVSRAVDGLGLTPRASARFGGGGDPDISQLLQRYAAATAISPSPDLAARVLRSIAALPAPTATHRYVAAVTALSPGMALAAFRDVLRIAMGDGRSSRLVRGQALALVLLTVMAGSAFAAAGAAGVELVLRRIDPSPQVLMPVVPLPESSASPSSDPEITVPASDPPLPSDPAATDQGGLDQTFAPTPDDRSSNNPGALEPTSTPAPSSGPTPHPTPPPTARPSDAPGPTPTPDQTSTPRPTETPGPPDPTNTPRPTKSPRPTDTPHPTQHPTHPPEQTDEPGQTDAPDETDAPSTQEPDETDPPDDGGGGDEQGSALSFLAGWWWLW